MNCTTNDAVFDWCPVFHHPANELRVPWCGGVISPSQLEDSDRDEKRGKKTAERGGEEIEPEMRHEELRESEKDRWKIRAPL